MSRVKFISSQYLKDNSAIQGDVDDSIIEPYIFKAQDVHIAAILGSALYSKLKTDIISGSVTGIYKTILDDYIMPCLLEWATYECLPFISIKLTNKSVTKRSSEYGQPAELFEVKYLREAVRDLAEYQSQRATNYLKENISSITEYQNPGSGIDTIKPNSSSYFNGIYLGNGGTNCNYGLDL